MDFDLSEEDLALQKAMRDLCRGRFGLDKLRSLSVQQIWPPLCEAGVFSLRDEPDLGMTQAVIVFEELGRALIPGPLVGSHIVRTDSPVACVDAGRKPIVIEHLSQIHKLLAFDEERAWLVDASSIINASELHDPIDPLTPMSRVDELAQGDSFGDAHEVRLEAMILTAALLTGIAAATCEMAVEYAKERKQFDRAIGSFQAIKHICADMLVRSEISRAAVLAAGVRFDDPASPERDRAATAAKLLANEAALTNSKACVQVHGGMGFTWEVDVHLYVKRAAVLASQFGSTHEMESRMAELV
ncbi:MAG: acyl-CoA dehydrogenase family protein [Actinomycetota bacterium]